VIVATALPTSSQQSDFLPGHYESIQALDLQAKAFPAAFTPSVIVVVTRDDGKALSAADSAKVKRLASACRRPRWMRSPRV
jgi:RND superfamily putative drug exporter